MDQNQIEGRKSIKTDFEVKNRFRFILMEKKNRIYYQHYFCTIKHKWILVTKIRRNCF